jgi:hypothetical protein
VGRIPKFKSIVEEAEFWDTHDSEDYAGEFEQVDVEFAHSLRHKWILTIDLDEESFGKVKQMAETIGEKPEFLVRSWVLEHLREISGQP